MKKLTKGRAYGIGFLVLGTVDLMATAYMDQHGLIKPEITNYQAYALPAILLLTAYGLLIQNQFGRGRESGLLQKLKNHRKKW